MKNNPVGWFEIYVDDMSRAKKFYESVFGVTLEKLTNSDHEMWAFPGNPSTYGSPGSLVKIDGVPAGRNSVLVYFSCADCAVEEKRVLESGGRVAKSKFDIGQYGAISLVFDSEGNMFGLHSMASK